MEGGTWNEFDEIMVCFLTKIVLNIYSESVVI